MVFRKCLFLVSYQEEMEDNHAVFFRRIEDNPRPINHNGSVDLIGLLPKFKLNLQLHIRAC